MKRLSGFDPERSGAQSSRSVMAGYDGRLADNVIARRLPGFKPLNFVDIIRKSPWVA